VVTVIRVVGILTAAMVATTAFAMTGDARSAPESLADAVKPFAAPPTQVWARRYAGVGSDSAAAVAYSPDGTRVYVTGSTSDDQSTQRNNDMLTIAYDALTGATLWSRRYGGTPTSQDDGWALRASPDGTTVFVVGSSESSSGGGDYITIAYDAATGEPRWRSRFDSVFHTLDYPKGLAVSPDGSSVFVTGNSLDGVGRVQIATVSYDALTGSRRWIERYGAPGSTNTQSTAIAVSPDSTKVFVTGHDQPTLGNAYDAATLAYDAASGNRIWAKQYDDPLHGDDEGTSIAVAPSGSVVYVGGGTTGANAGIQDNPDFGTFAYDASTGALLWLATYVGVNEDKPDSVLSIAVSPDGTRIFVAGQSDSSSGSDYATVAYDTNGQQLWASRYDGPRRVERLSLWGPSRHARRQGGDRDRRERRRVRNERLHHRRIHGAPRLPDLAAAEQRRGQQLRHSGRPRNLTRRLQGRRDRIQRRRRPDRLRLADVPLHD
jgi:DNA-binding beta-propeller fold protein YncE